MTERQRIESAIRAGCMATPGECHYPKCTTCHAKDASLAAIRAYLVASREPSEAMLAALRQVGADADFAERFDAMKRAELSEFDAAAAEMQKARP